MNLICKNLQANKNPGVVINHSGAIYIQALFLLLFVLQE